MITDFYSRLKKLFTDSSLQSKLVWIYFLLIILPLGFFTFYAVHQLSALVKKQTLASVHKAFDNTADAVEGELGRLGSVLDILTMDQIVYQVSSPAIFSRESFPAAATSARFRLSAALIKRKTMRQ